MRLFALGAWLGGMWLFGGIITAGLLSFNLEAVRAGDPTLPYMFAGVGYTGLWLTIIAFVARFQLSMSARRWQPAEAVASAAGAVEAVYYSE